MKAFIEICRFILTPIFSTFLRVKVYDRDKVIKEGPVIFAANHETMIDMIFIEYKIKRHIRWMAKAELFEKKFLGAFLRFLQAFPVRRGTMDISAAKMVFTILKEGGTIGIFPQGTRSKGKGRAVKARHGVAKFAVEAGVPIQPVAIYGDFKLFGKIKIRYGNPIYFEKKADGTNYTREEYTEMAQQVLDYIYDLTEVPDGNSKS
ncbi:MAG: 1-acyl-sn-glycerol-3-phosphate acyltransferase [Clostridia bacterium]|nr:1-acyl-sn-glycerol-3-phosphate acyltransferase [Clostridia bacterium]